MSQPEQNQSDLATLLRCKRYEQPPPGYFHSFSDKVIARIEASEASEQRSWWDRLLERFDARPVFICAYGLAVSGLLLTGFRLSQAFEAEIGATPGLPAPWLAASPAAPALWGDAWSHPPSSSAVPDSPLAANRVIFHEEPGQLGFPGSGLHIQRVGFGFPSR